MDGGITKAGFNIGMFLAVTSGLLLPFQTPGTAEFIITVTTFVMGIAFAAGVILVSKLMQK